MPPAVPLVAISALIALAIYLRSGSGGGEPTTEPDIPYLPETALHEPPSDEYKHRVLITTDPVGAEVVCFPLEWETGRPQSGKAVHATTKTPVEIELSSGMYLVVAYTEDRFHEVYRTVPRLVGRPIGIYWHDHWEWDESTKLVKWPSIRLFPNELAGEELERVDGAESFAMSFPSDAGKVKWQVPPFLLGTTELTIGQYQRFNRAKTVHRRKPPELSAGMLTWDAVAHYAECRGLRLPDLVECEFAATQGGTRHYPWGNEPPPAKNWRFDLPLNRESYDRTESPPGILDLCSRLGEWTATRTRIAQGSDQRVGLRYIVRGCPPTILAQPAIGDADANWNSVNQYTAHPGIGVRVARSVKPRLILEDFLIQKAETP